MLSGNRLQHVALGGLVIGLVLLTPLYPQAQTASEPPSGKKSAADITHKPKADGPKSEPIAPSIDALRSTIERIAKSLEAVTAKQEPADKTEREKADLWAQQEMANWAFWVFIAAGAQVFVAAVGLGFIYCQLRQSDDRTRRELRAYLSVEPGGINQMIGRTETIGIVHVRNVGKLPARNVFVVSHMRTDDRDWATFDPDPDNPTWDRVIQPGAIFNQGSDSTFRTTEIRRLLRKYAFVWGVAYYDDGYGKRRFTRFCHRYAIASYNRTVRLAVLPRATVTIIGPDKARYHEYGNSAD